MVTPVFEPSALLARVFDDKLLEQPFSVLDVGGVGAETLEYFSNYTCRITVLGLLDDLFVPEPPSEEDPYRAHRAFESRLDILNGKYDVCLFWDYPNYLSPPTLRAFAEVLAPALHARTRGHVFAGLNNRQGLPAVRYGIKDNDTFSLRPLNQPPLKYVHTQGELADAFHYFKVARGSLREGRVEVQLEHI